MKLIIFLLTCALFATTATAQKKLKILVDKETGDTTWSTSDVKIYTAPGAPRAVGEYLKCSVFKNRHGLALDLAIQTGRTTIFSIASGATADIKLTDGSVVAINSLGEHRSRTSKLDYGCYMFAFYRLDRLAIQRLKGAAISEITVHSSIGDMEYLIKEKFSKVIAEQLEKF